MLETSARRSSPSLPNIPGGRSAGFTLVEALVAALTTMILIGTAWLMFRGGSQQIEGSSGHLEAMQDALLLMENIQQDIRQATILAVMNPETSCPPWKCSFNLSNSRRSLKLRRALEGNEGVPFEEVTYQLVDHPTHDGLYSIHRIVASRTSSDEEGTRDLGLALAAIHYEFVARIEDSTVRQFIKVSVVTVDPTSSKASTRPYFLSNVFQISPPETAFSPRLGLPGFASKFPASRVYGGLISSTESVGPPAGNEEPLSPPPDVLNRAGNPYGENIPETIDPFEPVGSWPPEKREFLMNALDFLRLRALGPSFRGMIYGGVPEPHPPGRQRDDWTPGWYEPFAIDATEQTTQPISLQLAELLERLIPRGAPAVAEMGHWFSAPGMNMVTVDRASRIVRGY